MEGSEVSATLPQVWDRRLERRFDGNRLEHDILARAYDLIAPRPSRSVDERQRFAAEGGES
jgi:hypothetical protein